MTQTYKVQVSMNQAHLVEPGFVWKQGDFGFNLEIEVLDFDTSGVTPQIIFRKSAGAVESTSVTQSSNKFTYTIRGTELDTPGPGICDLKLKNSTTQRISTASFKFFVIPDTEDGLNQEASSYSDTIAQIVDGFDDEIDDLRGTDTYSGLIITQADTTRNGFVDNNGNFVSNNGYKTTELIKTNAESMTFVGNIYSVTGGYKNLWCYDKDQNPIKPGLMNISSGTDQTVSANLHPGTEYITFTTANYADNKFKLIKSINSQHVEIADYTEVKAACETLDDEMSILNKESYSVKHNPSGTYSSLFGWNNTQGFVVSNYIYKNTYLKEITFKNALSTSVTFGFSYVTPTGKCLKVFDFTGATGQSVSLDYVTTEDGYLVIHIKAASVATLTYSTSEVQNAISCKLGYLNGLPQAEYPTEGETYAISISNNTIYPSFTISMNEINYEYIVNCQKSIFYNKKIAFMGDSLTAGYLEGGGYVSMPYPSIAARDLKLGGFQNLGIASTSISTGGNPSNAMCERYTSIDSDVDFIVIMGGTNDHIYGTPLGEITDTTPETFYGALYVMFEGIRETYPNAELIMCTPIQKVWVGNNSVGLKFIDYVEAIRNMCDYCSVTCLDLYSKSGLTFCLPEMRKYFLKPDETQGGLHCNQAGYEYLGHKVALLLPTVI